MMCSASSYETSSALTSNGHLIISRRPRQFILNSYDRTDVGRSVEEIIDSIRPEIFYKSDELEVMPGTFADLHRNVEYDGNKWYVKLFVNDDGDASVQVLSANWEGCPH